VLLLNAAGTSVSATATTSATTTPGTSRLLRVVVKSLLRGMLRAGTFSSPFVLAAAQCTRPGSFAEWAQRLKKCSRPRIGRSRSQSQDKVADERYTSSRALATKLAGPSTRTHARGSPDGRPSLGATRKRSERGGPVVRREGGRSSSSDE